MAWIASSQRRFEGLKNCISSFKESFIILIFYYCLQPAVETHEMLYQVMQRHNFLPEAFTTDFQVHWGQHPLRPEFVESTYFLYRATGDPYYLEAGAKVMSSLQRYARVPCGIKIQLL